MAGNQQLKRVDFKTLKLMSDNVHKNLLDKQFPEQFIFEDYHGFEKALLSDERLTSILEPFGLTTQDMQIEIVRVTRDLSNQIHHHKIANAFITVLGDSSGYPQPKNAFVFLDNHWAPIIEGEKIEIGYGRKHGFSIAQGGSLYFLSVQNPPIVRGYDNCKHDDYWLDVE
jgi:hypothetical protein